MRHTNDLSKHITLVTHTYSNGRLLLCCARNLYAGTLKTKYFSLIY